MDNATAQIVSTAIFTIGTPLCVGLAIHIAHILAQRLPEQQRLALEQFARQAAQQVEQQYSNQSNPGKKALALASITNLFKAFGLPAPSQEAIDIAIEAAVLQLPKHTDPPVTNG